MKFDRQALSLALLCSFALDTDAFVPQKARKNSAVALLNSKVGPRVTHGIETRLFASDSDDGFDDEDEDEDDPLGKGIDSVSWLPSVIGARSVDISSVKKVRVVSFEPFRLNL